MKKKFIESSLTFIKKGREVSELEEKRLRYGLEAFYNLITKTIVIVILAIWLNILPEVTCFGSLGFKIIWIWYSYENKHGMLVYNSSFIHRRKLIYQILFFSKFNRLPHYDNRYRCLSFICSSRYTCEATY